MRRRLSLVVTLLALSMAIVPRAEASLWTGACAVNVRFSFSTPIRTVLTAPNYSVTVSQVADVDPTKTGSQGCAVTLDPLNIGRATAVSASGTSTEFSCSAVVASGGWNQQWVDSSGSGSPPPMVGSHTVSGTWGNWQLTLVDDNLAVVGVADLTVAASSAADLSQCPLNGLWSLTMTGVLVFQDP
jgi:hypothetical protein